MDSKEKDMRMGLLQELMDEMDKNAIPSSKKDGKEPIAQVTEVKSKEVPLSELKDVMKEKMGSTDQGEEVSEDEHEGAEDAEIDQFEKKIGDIQNAEKNGADEEEEEDAEISDFVKKIRAIQASKKAAGK